MEEKPKVNIVIINYNGWEDTLECLESVLRLDYINFQIIVVDNASTNNSFIYLRNWADGNLNVFLPSSNTLRSKSFPPYTKPVKYQEIQQNEIYNERPQFQSKCLFLINSSVNGGFAAGNNIGIRFSLQFIELDYIWLLNNDTVVDKDSLTHLVRHYQNNKKDKIGLIGSKLLHYHNPHVIQAIGGSYNHVLGTVKQYGANLSHDIEPDGIKLSKIDFVVGASMFLPVEFVKEVGFMSEDYFLYFEELDWVHRGKSLGWNVDFCLSSCVYHKEGASTGSTSKNGKSFIADYYDLKNRIVFTKRFYPNYRFTVFAGFIPVLIKRVLRGQFDRVGKIIKLVWEMR
ncbi:glycosyltransferase family 2 protein [soil metagenome]